MQLSHRFVLFIMVMGAVMLSWMPVLHWPFKWLQTYYHEISHGLAAFASGGEVTRIVLRIDGAGVCYTKGGIRSLTLLAGYLGSVFWGVLIFLSTTVKSHRVFKGMLLMLGVLLAFTLALWSRDLVTVGIVAVLMGLLILQWRMDSIWLAKRVFQFLGVYILIDAIKAPLNLIDGRHRGDGAMLSDLTGLPEIVWIIGWIGFALLGLYLAWWGADRQRPFHRVSLRR